jgi:putative integral membrane protein (TIGR02587 family)
MTNEMWSLGFTMDRLRLGVFLAFMIPVLIGLSYFAGFEETPSWTDGIRDAFVALMVGFVTSAVMLAVLNLATTYMPRQEILGKLTLLAIPSSFGAAIASSQLGKRSSDTDGKQRTRYGVELFYMTAGAIFFAFNVAPTEEILVLGFKMSPWHAVITAALSLAMMHAFVYMVEFRGQEHAPQGVSIWSIFARFTVVGYALSLAVSAYVLWTFGRFEGSGLTYMVTLTIVLGFAATLGASAARLIF